MKAVIMAGGEGTRLRPVTYSIPKPLLPVGKKPIAEIIVNQLKHYGFDEIIISVGYKAELIKKFFNNGADFGVNISYIEEKTKLGTAGSLFYLKDIWKDNFIVMMGDVLSEINLKDLFEYHQKSGNLITACTSNYSQQIPFGVLEVNGGKICEVKEKPEMSFKVNAGIYCISPQALSHIPENTFYNMTDLINSAITDKKPVGAYEIKGLWTDLGRSEDFELAVKTIESMKLMS